MNKNEVLTLIEKNYDETIFMTVNEYILDEGTYLFQRDFPTVADEVRLEELYDIELLSYDEEVINKDIEKISGELSIGTYLSGYQYFDREYHFISAIEKYILMKFSFYKENEHCGDFEGIISQYSCQ